VKKTLALWAVAVLMAGGLLGYFHFRTRPVPLGPEDALTRYKQASEFWLKKGRAGLEKKYFTPQVAVYERLVHQYPESLDLRKKLATAYFSSGNYEKASPLLEDLKTKAADAEVFYELAVIADRKGEKEIARENLDRSLALDPQHERAKELAAQLK